MAPLLYAFILLLPLAASLIGFNCDDHGFNKTTLSLLDICDYELVAEIEGTEETYV